MLMNIWGLRLVEGPDQTILCICNVNLMISSLNVLYITITIHLPDISIQTKTTNYAVKREATSPYLLLHYNYTVFYICFSNFPLLLYFSESANVLSVGWSCHYHHVRTELVIHISLPASTLMYVLITFFTKIVSILKRCWNLRQVINFEYKLRSVSRQILRVRI